VLKRGVRFTPADLLTAGFSLLLVLAGLLRFGAVSDPLSILLIGAAGLLPVGVARLRAVGAESVAARVALDFSMIVSLLVIFDNLGPLIRAVHPVDRDAWLIASDRWLLGTHPTRALESFATPLLSDVLTVCYALYYFHPIVLAALLWADDLRLARTGLAREFPRFAFTILAVFYVSYAGYFLVPAIGPRFTIQHAAPLPRGAVSRTIDSTLDRLEKNKRNCFPSGHTMVTVAVLIEGARRSRRTFLAFLPFALGLIAATVYGRFHYVTDVLGGLVLVAVTVPLARAAYDRVAATVGTGLEKSR
jgi:membrane-associated phospholipid phosphatase